MAQLLVLVFVSAISVAQYVLPMLWDRKTHAEQNIYIGLASIGQWNQGMLGWIWTHIEIIADHFDKISHFMLITLPYSRTVIYSHGSGQTSLMIGHSR